MNLQWSLDVKEYTEYNMLTFPTYISMCERYMHGFFAKSV